VYWPCAAADNPYGCVACILSKKVCSIKDYTVIQPILGQDLAVPAAHQAVPLANPVAPPVVPVPPLVQLAPPPAPAPPIDLETIDLTDLSDHGHESYEPLMPVKQEGEGSTRTGRRTSLEKVKQAANLLRAMSEMAPPHLVLLLKRFVSRLETITSISADKPELVKIMHEIDGVAKLVQGLPTLLAEVTDLLREVLNDLVVPDRDIKPKLQRGQ
jgi:hypothetical protein